MPVCLRSPSSTASTGSFGNGQLDVQPLRDGDGESAAADRLDRDPIHRDEIAFEPAESDVVSAHGRCVYEAQPHAAAGLDLDHFRIGEGAAVGEKASY